MRERGQSKQEHRERGREKENRREQTGALREYKSERERAGEV